MALLLVTMLVSLLAGCGTDSENRNTNTNETKPRAGESADTREKVKLTI